MEEGSSSETFDPMSAVKKWSIHKFKHATEEIGSHSEKSDNYPEVSVKSLSDNDSYDEEENISVNGNEEGYLFSCDSKQNIFFW